MKVFVSWSGERSRAVATALKEWLPDVLQDATAWMSEHDLDAGVRWAHRLSSVLEEAKLGIICLTPENQGAAWLLFEAGALSKSIQESRLIPYLIGMSPSDVRSPLSQFQCVVADKVGTRRLVESINSSSGTPLPSDRLGRLFEKWWPDLESRLRSAQRPPQAQVNAPVRPDREVLNEILDLVRSVAQHATVERPADTNTLRLVVDPRSFTDDGVLMIMDVDNATTVSDFLDSVYFQLNKRNANLRPYTYIRAWVLKNEHTGKLYDDIGIDYCATYGEVRDNTPIAKLGIRDGDRLAVLRPSDPST